MVFGLQLGDLPTKIKVKTPVKSRRYKGLFSTTRKFNKPAIVMIRFSTDDLDRLDTIVRALGITRSSLIRQAANNLVDALILLNKQMKEKDNGNADNQ